GALSRSGRGEGARAGEGRGGGGREGSVFVTRLHRPPGRGLRQPAAASGPPSPPSPLPRVPPPPAPSGRSGRGAPPPDSPRNRGTGHLPPRHLQPRLRQAAADAVDEMVDAVRGEAASRGGGDFAAAVAFDDRHAHHPGVEPAAADATQAAAAVEEETLPFALEGDLLGIRPQVGETLHGAAGTAAQAPEADGFVAGPLAG